MCLDRLWRVYSLFIHKEWFIEISNLKIVLPLLPSPVPSQFHVASQHESFASAMLTCSSVHRRQHWRTNLENSRLRICSVIKPPTNLQTPLLRPHDTQLLCSRTAHLLPL